MKHLFLSFGLFILTIGSAVPHGLGGDVYAPDNEPAPAHERSGSPPEKTFAKPFDTKPRWWSASLATGWTSREMHYGVDETGPYGAYTTELALRIERLKLSVWSGFGTGLNLGYNTTAYYGWNHFQFGLKASWAVNRFISIYGGISYSVAMTALRQIDQQNEVWAGAGLTFSY